MTVDEHRGEQMRKTLHRAALSAAAFLVLTSPAMAEGMCATQEQKEAIQAFYADNPGTMPAIASQRLSLPEAVIVSGLPDGVAASAPADMFPDVWAAMNGFEAPTFLIMKGRNVFEIASTVGTGKPSETSDYYNIAYEQPLRGHLRPDLYTSIYAVQIPVKDDIVLRGVLFYDDTGGSVFGTFVGDEGAAPSEAELAKFSAVYDMVSAAESVCP